MQLEATFLHVSPSDARLRRLAEFMGVKSRMLDAGALDAELQRVQDHELCILASASAINAWCGDNAHTHCAINRLRQKAAFLFVYGFAPENNTASLATSLADEQISEVRAFDQARLNYEVAASKPEFTFDFSGLLFGPVHNHTDFAFACSCTSGRLIPLVSIAGLPFWALSQKDGCSTFLLACNDIVDLDDTTEGTLDTGRYFSRLFPAAMFLKSVFKQRCWHTTHRFANFIFDDPLLKNSYGYLNYKSLVTMMDNCGFASTIAFIPWNYRRTEESVAQLFRERTDKLSICVHGCDHTGGEFAATDLGALNGITHLASRRMNSHRARTGIMHSEIMVFPQGRFSPEALNVLKSNNYAAAVNSTAVADTAAADHDLRGDDLRVRDLLDLAVTGYGGFPLFLRRYPGALEHLASDLFFGKPLLTVEHHAYLKDGGRRMLESIARMNAFGALEWRGLAEIMAKSYLQRDESDHVVACMLYTNGQVIDNESAHERAFLLTKPESDNVPIESVCINGRPIDFQICDKYVQFAAILPAHASAKVDILYRNAFPCAPVKRGFRKASRVWTRRVLSEFRDNVLCKSDLLFPRVQAVRHLLWRDRQNARAGRKLNAVTPQESSRSE
jgi:hypothetical protein